MIAYVKGTLEFIYETSAIVDVGGIGYLVNASPNTISRLPSKGANVQLFTYHQTTENGQSLHGFLTQEELRMFTLLISVSGIGPKVASGILGAMSPSQIMMAILAEDAVALSKAPGVGKKTAQRVMLELRDKIKTTSDTWEDTTTSGITGLSSISVQDDSKRDAMDALLALGYGRAEAMQAVLEIAEEGMAADSIIRLALKKLARSL
ncbi:MAG: Holliday junction branch migration protein RuvA [Defluviitaleaceae bacterium]|nr:Holliday junction branch migration protein RuvA [Defluviitaleaceae bacterium]